MLTADFLKCQSLSLTFQKNLQQFQDIFTYKPNPPNKSYQEFKGIPFTQKNDCMAISQTQQDLVVIFSKYGSSEFSSYSAIVIYLFEKKSGRHQRFVLGYVVGKVISMEISFGQPVKKIVKKKTDNQQQQENKNQQKKNQNNSSHISTLKSFNLLMCTQDGHFQSLLLNKQLPFHRIRIDIKPIKRIILPKYHKFTSNTAILLSNDNAIHFVNLDFMEKIGVMRYPPVNEKPLNIDIDLEGNLMLQSTCEGLICIWNIADKTLLQSAEKINKVYHNTTPVYQNHAISKTGLLSANFYGNLILLITKKGLLKLVAIDLKDRQQWVTIINHQLSSPTSIQQIQLLLDKQCVILLRDEKKKKKQSWIQFVYLQQGEVYEKNYLQLKNIKLLRQFWLSEKQDLIMCIGQQFFWINQVSQLLRNQQKDDVDEVTHDKCQ